MGLRYTDDDLTEDEVVEMYRLEQLLNAGYTVDDATRLAENREIDLHEAVDLVVKRGCAPATAVTILL